jgi:SAM-dependent methyltransferase
MKEHEIKKAVREGYAEVARKGSSCCGGSSSLIDLAAGLGYSQGELRSLPDGANLGLGCGNPTALASLKKGEVVLDLGSGGGIDCFLAAGRVGHEGRVIGVDMTPEMLERARANAARDGYSNVEFRLGEIENLPVADSFVDAVISNCVINLSPRKDRVFSEAFRVLKPGGRLMVSDIVLTKELPDSVKNSVSAYVSCISGAVLKGSYLALISDAGFVDISVVSEATYSADCLPSAHAEAAAVVSHSDQGEADEYGNSVLSISVLAAKPKSGA